MQYKFEPNDTDWEIINDYDYKEVNGITCFGGLIVEHTSGVYASYYDLRGLSPSEIVDWFNYYLSEHAIGKIKSNFRKMVKMCIKNKSEYYELDRLGN